MIPSNLPPKIRSTVARPAPRGPEDSFRLEQVDKPDEQKEDVVIVKPGVDKKYYVTRDLLTSIYEPRSFFSCVASGTWADLKKPTREFMGTPAPGKAYQLTLTNTNPKAFPYVVDWLRDGALPGDMPFLDQSILKATAKLYSMVNLELELEHIYAKREKVRTNPTMWDVLDLADTIAPSIERAELNRLVTKGAKLDPYGVNKFVKHHGLPALDPDFLRETALFVTDAALAKEIHEFRAKTMSPEEKVESLVEDIVAQAAQGHASTQSAMVTEALHLLTKNPENHDAMLEKLAGAGLQVTSEFSVKAAIATRGNDVQLWNALALDQRFATRSRLSALSRSSADVQLRAQFMEQLRPAFEGMRWHATYGEPYLTAGESGIDLEWNKTALALRMTFDEMRAWQPDLQILKAAILRCAESYGSWEGAMPAEETAHIAAVSTACDTAIAQAELAQRQAEAQARAAAEAQRASAAASSRTTQPGPQSKPANGHTFAQLFRRSKD